MRAILTGAAMTLAGAVGAAEVTPESGSAGVWDLSSLRSLIYEISLEIGLDPDLVDAVVRVESAYNPRAVSRRGAMGLMQLMPATASRLRVANPFDPEENVRAGVRELSRLVDRYAGNLLLALAAYNAGEGAVQQYRGVPPYRETRQYVRRIMSIYTGRPYDFSSRPPPRPVQMMRDPGSGETVITNVGRSLAEPPRISGGPLGGGFGSSH
jgi:soluble lytic murein transglycosylase-like protein